MKVLVIIFLSLIFLVGCSFLDSRDKDSKEYPPIQESENLSLEEAKVIAVQKTFCYLDELEPSVWNLKCSKEEDKPLNVKDYSSGQFVVLEYGITQEGDSWLIPIRSLDTRGRVELDQVFIVEVKPDGTISVPKLDELYGI